MQRGIEHGYDQFISLVADKREMSKDQVDNIAQGRVWIGETALELGLVDELGYLEDGVKAAAELASLKTYDTRYIQRSLSKSELFWKELFQNVSVSFKGAFEVEKSSTILSLFKELTADIEAVSKLNDPKGVYAYCLACEL
jgi:protease-4